MSPYRPPDWTVHALCIGQWDAYDRDNPTRAMREQCASCPVERDCLVGAMRREAGLGAISRATVRGGLSVSERNAADTAPRDPPHRAAVGDRYEQTDPFRCINCGAGCAGYYCGHCHARMAKDDDQWIPAERVRFLTSEEGHD